MKKLLTALVTFVRDRVGHREDAFHNDALRANQPNEPFYSFSYWRSLVD